MPRRGENIYKRKDGRWEGRYNYTFDEYGKRHYCSIYSRSYQDIKEKLSKLRNSNKTAKSCRSTVNELFAEWLKAVKLKVKLSTYSCYKMKAEKHILPVFGNMDYSKLSEDRLHEFITKKITSGLSSKYVCDIVVVFKSMSRYVAKVHNCSDPIRNVVLPKKDKKELSLLSEEQQKRLRIAHNDSKRTQLAVMLSYNMGLRIGEVCGLMWSDIDFKANTVTIRRTVQRVYNGSSTEVIVGTPKSKSSVRTIPMPKAVFETLKQFKSDDSAYVLSGNEKFVEPRTLQYRFKSFLKKANLPSINFHCLRHMFATNCVKLGFDVKTLSEILGHSSVEVTLNRYVHSSMERKAACMAMVA